ncbi:phage major capsid protein, partial [Escherichia coli]|nr:phage major capsid protein [Escherichia coli]
MAVLRTLPGRIKTLNTRRVNILKGEQRRVSGSARVSLKRHIWLRDAGQCCLCGRVVDLCDSELDHRIALQEYAQDFIDYLRPQTIIGRFGQGGIPALRQVPFNIRVHAQVSGGAAGWVGEGKARPLTKFDFESITFSHAKVSAIAVLTEELIRFSSPAADALVRNALAEAVVARL